MQRSDLILTDSGGIQEEAPSLRKPVLVTRDVTERPEGVARAMARLVGTDPERIVAAISETLAGTDREAVVAQGNPYGDGLASSRIVAALLGRPFDEFGG
jgi:UDP-N-acetylglucosamine 2-epimerase (non-hydrolysing)